MILDIWYTPLIGTAVQISPLFIDLVYYYILVFIEINQIILIIIVIECIEQNKKYF